MSENALGTSPAPKDMVCVEGTELPDDLTTADKEKLIAEKKCAPYYVKSKDVFYRCIPTIVSDSALDALGIKDSDGKYLSLNFLPL